MSNNVKPININLDSELWYKVKVKALSERKTITQVVTELLEKYVGGK